MANFSPGPWKCVAAEFGNGDNKGLVAFWVRMPEPLLSKADANLIEAALPMYEALKAAEWGGNRGEKVCPVCRRLAFELHKTDCLLANALAKADGKQVANG